MKDLQEEINEMSYDDIAFMVLRHYGTKMKTQTLYKRVCRVLDMEFDEDHIGDFYELLAVNKKFLFVKGYWDLQTKHKITNQTYEEEDDFLDDIDFEDDEEENDESEEIYIDEDDDDIEEEDISGFIVTGNDLEEEV